MLEKRYRAKPAVESGGWRRFGPVVVWFYISGVRVFYPELTEGTVDMLAEARPKGGGYPKAAFYMQLPLLNARAGELWTIRFESEILTLLNPDNRPVISLHRDEAVRYIQFAYDILRGRTVSFVIIEGLKTYTFRCNKEQLEKLMFWLPHIGAEDVSNSIFLSGILTALIGILHLVLPLQSHYEWGICFLASGALGILYQKRTIYLVNGFLGFFAGLWNLGFWDLVMGAPFQVAVANVSTLELAAPVIVGVALMLWSVHQFSMLGIRHQIRVARQVRDERAAFLPGQSKLVRRVAKGNIVTGVVFGLYTAAILIGVLVQSRNDIRAGLEGVRVDLVLFGVLTALSIVSAVFFLRQKTPSYEQARVSAQLMVAAVGCAFWAFALKFHSSEPASFIGQLFSDNLEDTVNMFSRPYVLGSVLVCVILMNRWFARMVDQELEEQRG